MREFSGKQVGQGSCPVHMIEPSTVHQIITGDPEDFSFQQFPAGLFHFFCRYTRINTSAFHNRSFQYYRTSGNNAVGMNNTTIHYNGAHAYKYMIMQGTAVHQRIVANAYMITNNRGGFFVGTMDDCSVLNIYSIANAYAVYISPHHRIKPKTAIIARYNITTENGIWRNKTVPANNRCVPPNRNNIVHNFLLLPV